MAIETRATRPAEKLQRYPDFAARIRSAVAGAVQALCCVIDRRPADYLFVDNETKYPYDLSIAVRFARQLR